MFVVLVLWCIIVDLCFDWFAVMSKNTARHNERADLVLQLKKAIIKFLKE